MLDPRILLAMYCSMIVVATLFGGWLPSRFLISHTRMQVILSFVGGLMLGIGLLHMLPHCVVQTGSLQQSLVATLVGLLFTFFLIRIFQFHQHGPAGQSEEAHADCEHDHPHLHHHEHGGVHRLSWTGVAIGMMIHTFVDGVALGAAVMSDYHHNPSLAAWGFGIFLAIALHQPLDAMSITTLMAAGGWSQKRQYLMTIIFSSICPFGAAVFVLCIYQLGTSAGQTIGIALGFSAGTFLCISLSDLLPEVQFHRHDRLKLSAALLLGVLAAYSIGWLEPDHAHSFPPAQQATTAAPLE